MDEAAPMGRLEEGKEKFWDEARVWNATAREQGHSPAIYELAQSYRFGNYFVLEVDMDKAVELHKLAAKSYYPRSQLALGNIYLERAGNQGDIDYGLSCLIAAANSGMKMAQKALARVFAGGQPGVAQNVSMAREWLRQAENNTTKVERNIMLWLTHN
jgi:TPR repeat protein